MLDFTYLGELMAWWGRLSCPPASHDDTMRYVLERWDGLLRRLARA